MKYISLLDFCKKYGCKKDSVMYYIKKGYYPKVIGDCANNYKLPDFEIVPLSEAERKYILDFVLRLKNNNPDDELIKYFDSKEYCVLSIYSKFEELGYIEKIKNKEEIKFQNFVLTEKGFFLYNKKAVKIKKSGFAIIKAVFDILLTIKDGVELFDTIMQHWKG